MSSLQHGVGSYYLTPPQGARGLARGRWLTRDGQLVATTAQEGLMRRRGPNRAR